MPAKVHIDFSRPIALFPLPSVVLFPHTFEWMVAFEPRYRQMVEDCLRARADGSILDAAPIAMATYAGRGWAGERVGDPPLRPAACVAKIVEHRPLPDGRHQILLHGFCRAHIDAIAEPEGRRLYRLARLTPVDRRAGAPRRMPELERGISSIISSGELRRWQQLEPVRTWLGRASMPTDFILEQLLNLLSRGDESRYRMLAEPSGRRRAQFALSELAHIGRMLDHAAGRGEPPKRGYNAN
jgi:Lon protease-like protein